MKLPVHRFREGFVDKWIVGHPRFSKTKNDLITIEPKENSRWIDPPFDKTRCLKTIIELGYLTQRAKGCKWLWDVDAIRQGEKSLTSEHLRVFELFNKGETLATVKSKVNY